ncbi:MAG TPA: hypothetical protein VLL94_12640, partial [Nitrospiraceae bacterium]|nr:hypothetical protein [Nitrospiraceae bacterium]
LGCSALRQIAREFGLAHSSVQRQSERLGRHCLLFLEEPRSPRVGSQRIPLPSYNRVPISKLLANPTDYHLREIRIAGTVRAVETHLMTRGCGKHHELTVISLEDESGAMDVFDQGACGRNTSPVRAPMLAPGDRVDLLVQVVGGMKTDEPGASPEVIVLWIDRAQE